MFKKILTPLFFIIFLASLVWLVLQMRLLNEKIASFEIKVGKIAGEGEAVSGAPGTAKKEYELTIEMWQTFEQELQDYKQRVKEGKQSYDQQQSGWAALLAELKKSVQEYDKFIVAEGEFWEKQLKNYDKLLARTEERFELLGQVLDELKGAITDVQNLAAIQQTEAKEEAEVIRDERKRAVSEEPRQITPQIKGGGDYRTYPAPEEKKEKEEEFKTIKGKISGSGDYVTY